MTTRRFIAVILVLIVAGASALVVLATRGAPAGTAALEVDPEGIITWQLGSDAAPVEVWEASDFQCPDCARYEAEEMPALRARFIETGKVRWRFIFFALPNHAEAAPATHAFACAQEQGEGPATSMHRGLFESQAEWAHSPGHLAVFRGIAERNSLDLGAWDSCMESGRYREAVARSWSEAQRVGIPGTPTVLLFGRFYVGGLTANQLERLLSRPPE